MDYFIKANGLVFLLWLFYYAFLRNETFFKSIRVYFLLGLIIIISIPLIEIPIYVEEASTNFDWNIVQAITTNDLPMEQVFDWMPLLIILYSIGVVFLSFKFIIQLFSLGKLLSNHKINQQGNYKLIEIDKEISPFSFFNFIIYNKHQFTNKELNQIINHEKTHVNQWHSLDTLLTYILQIVFWFNPFAWLYKKEVGQNLEFLADDYVLKTLKSQQSYQNLILKTSIPNYQMVLVNNFYNSFLKKRITMLHTEKSNSKSQWKFALIIPLLMVFIFSLNTKTIAQEKKENTNFIVRTVEVHAMVLTKKSSKDELDKISESFAEKGLKVEFERIKRNKNNDITIIHIEAKADNGKTSASYAADENEGINPIKIKYDNKNNSLSIGSSDGKRMKGYAFSKKGKSKTMKQKGKGKGKSYVFISDENDNEEHSSTKIWVTKDGDTTKIKSKKIIIEIEENEDGEHEETYDIIIDEDDEITENKFFLRTNGKEDPIYILNGKEISKKEMEKIKPDNINSINVLKGKSAKDKYGDKGKNGVIEITSKKE